MHIIKLSGYLLAACLLNACENVQERDPNFAPVEPAYLKPPAQNTGSIYQSGYDVSLFEDHSSRRVGDILTVTLAESTRANKKSDLTDSKSTSISAKVPSFFGVQPGTILGQDVSTEVATSDTFKGAGAADQSNNLVGDLTVTVVEVLPNKNLKIRGEKRVTLNRGSEYIRLSGMVRPIDIDANNSVPSTKVADATIMYTGDGAVADASKVGWLGRFFLSPFFPF